MEFKLRALQRTTLLIAWQCLCRWMDCSSDNTIWWYMSEWMMFSCQ